MVENAVEVFRHYGVHLSSSLLMQIFSWLAGLCYYGDDMEEYRRLCRWENNIKMDLNAIGDDMMNWMETTQD